MAVDRKKKKVGGGGGGGGGGGERNREREKKKVTKRRGKFHDQKTKTQRQCYPEEILQNQNSVQLRMLRRGNSLNPTTHRHTENNNNNNT